MATTIQVRNDNTKDIYSHMTEEELFAKLETSRKHANEGKYKEAGTMVAEMRTKYGL